MAESMIDIRSMVQSVIMEEVNNLGIRAVVREKIEQVGELNKDDVRNWINEVIDSYIRSIDIEKLVCTLINTKVAEIVEHKVSQATQNYLEGNYFSYKPTRQLEELILNDLKRQFYEENTLKVINIKKEKN